MEDLEIPERVKKYINLDESGCWLWTGAKTKRGYGGFLRGKQGKQTYYYAHRFMYELANGPITNGLFCCHHCDVRNCVNPDHMFLGTTQDNTRDMIAKGRYKHPHPMSEETKDAIRADYASNRYNQNQIRKKYHTSDSRIKEIIEGYPGSWYIYKYQPEFIREIKELYRDNNFTYNEIASMYGLSFNMVRRIIVIKE